MLDLSEAESKGKPFEEVATEAELKEEEVCNQERYLSLYHDEAEQQDNQEEEAKRLHYELHADNSTKYGQVGFDYSACHPPAEKDENSEPTAPQEPISYQPSPDDDVYIPPAELNVPTGMEIVS